MMDSSDNDSVSIGCIDFGAGEKSFGVYLGNVHNGLLYNMETAIILGVIKRGKFPSL